MPAIGIECTHLILHVIALEGLLCSILCDLCDLELLVHDRLLVLVDQIALRRCQLFHGVQVDARSHACQLSH